MGKQVGFFADGADFHDLLVFAEQCGFRAFPNLIETDDEPEGVAPTEFQMSEKTGMTHFHLIPSGVSAAEVLYDETDDARVSRVMKHVSPVTEIRPSQREGNKLSDGRIHFNMASDVSHFRQGNKGYERLARHVRKWQKTRQYRFHVGPHTANEVTQAGLAIVHWNEELNIA